MASAPEGDPRLAGLDEELRRLRGRLEEVRRGIAADARGKAAAPAAASGGLPVASGSLAEEAAESSAADDEVLARLRGLLDELRTLTGESPP